MSKMKSDKKISEKEIQLETLNDNINVTFETINSDVPEHLREDGTILKNLKYEYSKEELEKMYKKLAALNIEFQNLEDEKKSIVSDFKAKTDVCRAHINMIAQKLNSGFEYRDVEGMIFYHFPKPGLKILYRKDIERFESIEAMTDSDNTLFRQYQEEQ